MRNNVKLDKSEIKYSYYEEIYSQSSDIVCSMYCTIRYIGFHISRAKTCNLLSNSRSRFYGFSNRSRQAGSRRPPSADTFSARRATREGLSYKINNK